MTVKVLKSSMFLRAVVT